MFDFLTRHSSRCGDQVDQETPPNPTAVAGAGFLSTGIGSSIASPEYGNVPGKTQAPIDSQGSSLSTLNTRLRWDGASMKILQGVVDVCFPLSASKKSPRHSLEEQGFSDQWSDGKLLDVLRASFLRRQCRLHWFLWCLRRVVSVCVKQVLLISISEPFPSLVF